MSNDSVDISSSEKVQRPGTADSGVSMSNGHFLNEHQQNGHIQQPVSSDIAICGIGLRLPGGIRNCDDYWNLLYHGVDARIPVPSSRYNLEGFDDSLGGKDSVKVKHGYFLDEDLSCLDTSFFTFTKAELEKADPQQRLLLEVTRECLEDAGEVNYRGQQLGCYIGTFGDDWLMMSTKAPQQGGVHAVTGHGDLMMANRVSFEYDFRGPSMVIKTGCSASTIALHEACRAIQRGDASGAVVGGASMITTPALTATMSAGELLAPDGSCKTFDASADGYARAEAITAIYIKPLADALRDGNPVRAVIKGTSTNCDGKSVSLVTPNGVAQEALMRKAYRDAGLDPRETAFVECHGTGTPTGDPIETTAVGKVFGENGIYITSVKPNLGHSEGSAGLSSVIKCVLALEHNIIPPNIKFINPNPKIPFAEYNLTVPVNPTPFPSDRKQRVSIDSFGIGGSNAHVILEAYAPYSNGIVQQNGTALHNGKHVLQDPGPPMHQPRKLDLLLLSANTDVSLQKQINNHQEWVLQHPESVSDLTYTRAMHREHLPHRAYAILDGANVTETSGPMKALSEPLPLVMVFSGQGAQWPGMAKELIESDRAFRTDLLDMDAVLKRLSFPPTWNIIDELLKSAETTQVHKAELSQPLCTAVQVALFNKFSALRLTPTVAVGHSSGEIAAAYAAGFISMEEAITIAYYRGYVTTKQNLIGGMAAIGMGAVEVSEHLCDGVVLACENSPSSSTISGDAEKVDQVVEAIKQKMPDMFARKLKVNMAYHSHHMVPLSTEYHDLLKSDLPRLTQYLPSAKAEMFSSVTTKPVDDSIRDPSYWVKNLTSPVRFSPAVLNLLALKGDSIFIEIGPHSTLAGPLRQTCSQVSRPCHYVTTQSRGKDSFAAFLSAVGKLYQGGLEMDLTPMFSSGKAISGLPTYPWDHKESYWFESRISKAWRTRQYPDHCLLGSRILECTDAEPQWRNILHVEDEPWLVDHKLHDDIVFPFAGYIAVTGEAVRQLTHAPRGTGYRLRHVVAQTALLLSDSAPTELMTSLHRQRLNDTDSSEWFEFSVSSYSGSTWVKHCTGQVSILDNARTRDWVPEVLPRKVDASRIYSRLASVGFIYGPSFRGLSNVTSAVSEELAFAQIINRDQQSHSPFTLHPATIDAGLQLLLVAQAKGLGRNLAELCVPTAIEELEIGPGADVMDAKAWKMYGVEPCVEFASGEKVAFRASGIQFHALGDDETPEGLDVHAAARLRWLPHFDFVDVSTLFTPPAASKSDSQLHEELGLHCILETAERVRYLQPCQPHFARFRDWINQQIGFAAAGNYKLVENPEKHVALPRAERLAKIEELTTLLLELPQKALIVGIRCLFDNIDKLFTGEADTLDILLQDNVLAQIYNVMTFDYSKFLRLLVHTRPTLRVLELGAGTGGTTETILRNIVDVHGVPAYSTYTFTDISAGFFPAAKERFANASNLEFRVLDVSQDPLQQGFQEGSYDLIIAANVLHATPCLQQTLSNIRPLLKSDGMLVMTELCSVTRSLNYIFGNFSGWWLGEKDNRLDQPYVSVSRWDQELRAAGFSGADAVTFDAEESHRRFAVIVAKKQPTPIPNPSCITLLSGNPEGEIVGKLATVLEERGWTIAKRRIGDDIPKGQDIISCLDLEANFFQDISEEAFATFQQFVRTVGPRRILWLTDAIQVECSNPRSAQTLGVARTLRSELGLNFYTVEVDNMENQFSTLVSQLLDKIVRDEDNENLEPDREFVISHGVICVGRYQPFPLLEEASTKTNQDQGDVMKKVDIDKPGMLETMDWRILPIPETIPEHHVEIDVRAAGLNFRDVVYAMGLISSQSSNLSLGMEVSGTIRRLGSAVKGLSIGDRVMSFTYEGGFSTQVIVADHFVHKLPDTMSFEEAATIQGCFATVVYALLDVGRLRKGMSVLIHSACGGVGLSAIQVSQMMGAEIYATVGSEKKKDYLVKTYNIPRERIFNSRDASFLDGVMQQTAGKGVDLVLNSLPGELLHASWKCVAKNGSLLELGKRDLAGFGQLDMSRFLDNRSYCGIDVMYMMKEQGGVLRDVLQRTLAFFEQGKLKPLEPITSFDAADIKQAFRYLQGGNHMGKVILKLPGDPSMLEAREMAQCIKFSPDAAYLLVGGSGGLGRALAIWMAEHGAKQLIFLSRSATADSTVSTELESMGCAVAMIKGSVNNLEDVKEAIEKSPTQIKGVFHLAMVQRDSPFLDMKWADWTDANEPKVHGTWNLHQAFLGQPLDYFWLASSTVTVVDQPGQGNYKAGCTFIESFCQYRHSLGLPASVLSICPIEDVGFVAENPAALRSIKLQGLYTLGEKEFLDSVEASLANSVPQASQDMGNFANLSSEFLSTWENKGHIIMGLRSELHLDNPKNPTNWRRDRRMGIYHNLAVGDASDARGESHSLKEFLQTLTDGDGAGILAQESTVDFLAVEIGRKINDFLLKPDTTIDTSLRLSEMGLDSLTAIELRRWFRQASGLQVSVLEMMGAASLRQLGETVAARLGEKVVGGLA
ncbi:uncharacterized protein NECHADRAFT_106233 [Fusarium vanettenii 77-13-4]|uniref:Uncharacterized protein n=1 Tax=Fusarium vanettenii (strain ATCC MYA-4622 / CBS 123669 / FGSC 9596 / NRRL 45880 / 77-13-4) TaxID=660122 RepID=C7ZMY3_FUSV7|nr:uncharacterized protein NECHADRAFT_106233 [Fusarium vanettenii 77-13-4]EEU34613.1 hypothetical protein NECHADRAFT_106233 [Fusarium vanettenii 77-13-4]